MSLDLLKFLALVQAVFLVMLVTTLVVSRRLRPRRARRSRLESTALTRRIYEALSGQASMDEVLEDLNQARFGDALHALQRVGVHVDGEGWDTLTRRLRTTAWFEQLLKRSRSRHWWRRLDAAHSISIVGTDQDELLVRRLLRDDHTVVRLAAVPALKRVPEARLIDAALDLADRARTPTQHYVVETVSRLPGLDVERLREGLEASEDPLETRTLLDLAARLGLPTLLDAILPRLEDKALDVRIGAAQTLGRYPHPQATTALVKCLDHPDWQVRAQAAGALGIIGARDAAKPLFRVLHDPSWWVRLRAGIALRLIGEPGLQMLEGVKPKHDRYAADMAVYVLGLDGGALGEFGGQDVASYRASGAAVSA